MTDQPGEPPPASPEEPQNGPPPLPFHIPAEDAAPPPAADLTPRAFQFTGSAGEYFRIWIVNLLLSIATLGIYSAWAKVRRLRYFYGHTVVDGSTFGYHASPIAILKGRMIAYTVVATLAILGQVAPLLVSIFYLPLLVLMPIVLVRAFRFRAANSSFRGIRFGFDGAEPDAYRVYLLLPMLGVFTLGLLYPFVTARQREFVVGNSRHGQSPFALELPIWPVYRIYVTAALAAALLFVLVGTLVLGAALESGRQELPSGPGVVAALVLFYAGAGVLYVSVRTAFENLVWNHTTLDAHRFDSRLRIPAMLAIYGSNLVGIALTLGLAVPWARVRLARYRAQALTLLPAGPLVAEAQAGGAEESATGAELSDAMDLDFGL